MSDPFIGVWTLVLVVSIVVEAATVSMVSIWFAAGSLVSMAMAWLGFDVYVQDILFLLVSLLLIAFITPRIKTKFTQNRKATNADRIIGEKGIVTEELDTVSATGQVRVLGTVWSARTENGENLPVGTHVVVKNIEGVKAIVETVE